MSNNIKLYNFKKLNIINTNNNVISNNNSIKSNTKKVRNIKKNVFKTLLQQKPLIRTKRNLKYELDLNGLKKSEYKQPIKTIKDQVADIYLKHFLSNNIKVNNDNSKKNFLSKVKAIEKNSSSSHIKLNNYFISVNYQIINYYLQKYIKGIVAENEKVLLYLKGGNNFIIYKEIIQKQFSIKDDLKNSDTDYNVIILTNNYDRYKIIYHYVSKALIKALNILSHIYDHLFQNFQSISLSDINNTLSKKTVEYINEFIIKDNKLASLIKKDLKYIISIYNKTSFDSFNEELHKLIQEYIKDNNTTFYNYDNIYKIVKYELTNNSVIKNNKYLPILITSDNSLLLKKLKGGSSRQSKSRSRSRNISRSQSGNKFYIDYKMYNPLVIKLNSDVNKNRRYHYITINNTPSTIYNSGNIMSFDLYRLRFGLKLEDIKSNDILHPNLSIPIKKSDFFINNTHKNNKIYHYEYNDKVEFNATNQNVSPELIDISIISFEDSNYQNFLATYYNDTNILEKNFSLVKYFTTNNYMLIMSESYIIQDLQYTLFKYHKMLPYYDNKYDKRLSRFFYFILLDLHYQKNDLTNSKYKNVFKENEETIELLNNSINTLKFDLTFTKNQSNLIKFSDEHEHLLIDKIDNFDIIDKLKYISYFINNMFKLIKFIQQAKINIKINDEGKVKLSFTKNSDILILINYIKQIDKDNNIIDNYYDKENLQLILEQFLTNIIILWNNEYIKFK